MFVVYRLMRHLRFWRKCRRVCTWDYISVFDRTVRN